LLVEVFGWRPRCVLVASTGGGGDAGSALYLARVFEGHGARAVLAVLPWERFVRDPAPGPIPLEAFHGVERLAYTARPLPGLCGAVRRGRPLEPSGCRVAAAGIPVYLLDGWGGAAGVARGLEEAAGLHGCEAGVAFDVGGDVLATGAEEGLWSPLADSLGLAAVAEVFRGDGVVAVHSPGCPYGRGWTVSTGWPPPGATGGPAPSRGGRLGCSASRWGSSTPRPGSPPYGPWRGGWASTR